MKNKLEGTWKRNFPKTNGHLKGGKTVGMEKR